MANKRAEEMKKKAVKGKAFEEREELMKERAEEAKAKKKKKKKKGSKSKSIFELWKKAASIFEDGE